MSVRIHRGRRWGSAAGWLMAAWLAACASEDPPERLPAEEGFGGADRGQELVSVYACGACHQIPGIFEAPGTLGPPLGDWGKRRFIAGKVPNEPRFLIRWLLHPDSVKPGTAMPNLGLSEDEAHDIAAYLYSR